MSKKNKANIEGVLKQEQQAAAIEVEIKDTQFLSKCQTCGREQLVMGTQKDLAKVKAGRLPLDCGTHKVKG